MRVRSESVVSGSPLISDYVRDRSRRQEDFKVSLYLEDTIRSLGDKFQHMYIVERTPGFDDKIALRDRIFLEWNDQFSAIGIDPENIDEVLRRLPQLKPANQAIKQLKQAGYDGYPTVGQFDKNCYALILPKGKKHLSYQKTYLVVAKTEQDTYEDELSYFNLVADRLTKRFIELGVPDARASLQISNSPGLSTRFKMPADSMEFLDPEPQDELSEALSIKLTPYTIIPRPPAKVLSAEEADDLFNREATFKILLSYEDPEGYRQPTKKQVLDAISKMPELTPASQIVEQLTCTRFGGIKFRGYDGWFEVGKYPDSVYALVIPMLPNHIADTKYQQLILFSIYNSSQARIVNPDEEEIQIALNKAMTDAGFTDVHIQITSDNYFQVVHSGYCPPEERVRQALATIPGVSPDPTNPQPIGVPGYLSSSGKFTIEKSGTLDPGKASELGALGYINFDRTFSPLGTEQKAMVKSVEVDLHQIPALANLISRLKIDKVHIYLAENVDGY